MTVLLEIAAGLVLTGTLVVGALTLAAFELGRAISQDDQQREVAPVRIDCPRRAA
jgi:hypothetical protein